MVLAVVDTRPSPMPTELAACLVAGVYQPPPDLSLDTWLEHGQTLSRRWATLLWLVADWARVGVDYYGPLAWSHLAAIAGRDPTTMKKMVMVSRRFPPTRRRLGIPFARHAAVASLPDDVADRFLARAEREHWVQQDLYRAVRQYRGQPTGPKEKRRRAVPAGTTATTAIVTPGVTDHRDTAPIRCSGCMLTVGYAVGTLAVMSSGPAAVQRIEGGRLVMNAECTSCQSTTLVSLAALELPTPTVMGAGSG